MITRKLNLTVDASLLDYEVDKNVLENGVVDTISDVYAETSVVGNVSLTVPVYYVSFWDGVLKVG